MYQDSDKTIPARVRQQMPTGGDGTAYMGEATMTPAQKRKDTMLKKKYDDSDMKKNMQAQYGKEEGKKVYFATIRKQAMNKEEYISELSGKTLQSYKDKVVDQIAKRLDGLNMANRKIQDKKVKKIKPPENK